MYKEICLTVVSCTNCILCSEVWLLYVETHEKMDTQELLGWYHQVETPCIVEYSHLILYTCITSMYIALS